DLESVVLFDALDLVRRNVASKLTFTRVQTIDARGYFRHFDETDLLQRRTSAPIFVMSFEHQHVVWLKLDNLAGAGGDSLARPIEIAWGFLPTAAAHDLAAVTRDAACHGDVRRTVLDTHRIFVDHCHTQQSRPGTAS